MRLMNKLYVLFGFGIRRKLLRESELHVHLGLPLIYERIIKHNIIATQIK